MAEQPLPVADCATRAIAFQVTLWRITRKRVRDSVVRRRKGVLAVKISIGDIKRYLLDIGINQFAASNLFPRFLRWRVLRWFGISAEPCIVSSRVHFGGTRVRIGYSAYIGPRCFFDALDQITLGDRCRLAMDVLVITSSHALGPATQRAGASRHAPVVIGSGAWIGARVTILPGVSIGEGAVIAAGSVVTTDCPPNGLYAGVPATRKRDLANS